MKKKFYAELAYVLGLVILAFGTALMERADFGMSMVVAPAYILHLKLRGVLPFFSFGMAEYCLQAVLIVALCLVLRRFRLGYLFSFVTAVVYGLVLDLMMAIAASLPAGSFLARAVLFVLGILLCSVGVALLLRTYFAPEAYELVVKELSAALHKPIGGVKTVYDLVSLSLSVVLSFACFGWLHFEGVKLGTLITALVNGWIIGQISGWMDRNLETADLLPLRRYFTS